MEVKTKNENEFIR